MPSLKQGVQLVRNMGGRYIAFRVIHELNKRSGLFKRKFPLNPPFQKFISLDNWRRLPIKFFFNTKPVLKSDEGTFSDLRAEFFDLQQGKVPFFSSTIYQVGKDYDWLSNPDTGYTYDGKVHWSQINDYSKEAGDIKFVWEKSRFSFLYTIIRYDAHTDTGEDHADWVWKEILSWIRANPINCGPNYKCSQEISLRVLNWTFALNFYKNAPSLTEDIFQEIIFSIYWQLQHVFHNINFSRIAVRNNHAITETLTLYLGGLLYPFFPEASEWKRKGKKWFEEEISYQIYPDGTFLQFSMNYHRVVVQLMSWAIRLADLNGERFKEVVYERALKSLHFLTACMNEEDGWLPNYGANDGALFFKLNNNHYRDYRPQLEALSAVLGLPWVYGHYEDAKWLKAKEADGKKPPVEIPSGESCFEKGGYYLYRQHNLLNFIRCGKHKDRPSQADNLHLDIWYKGLNILHDAGSYKYNTNEQELRYFMGTGSHNTIMLDDYDQMQKGVRFIWYDWSQAEVVEVIDGEEFYQFSGTLKAFQYLDKKIRHYRRVRINKNKPLWEVEDRILHKPQGMLMKQIWHTSFPDLLDFQVMSGKNKQISPVLQEGWYSGFYGKKEPCTEVIFSSQENVLKTYISIKK